LARGVVAAYQADDELVLPNPETGNPYDTSKMGKRFEAAMQAAGMGDRYGREDGITFHSFRHTFATRCAAAGVSLRTLQEWLGHRDYKTVLIYADYHRRPPRGRPGRPRLRGGHQFGHQSERK